MVTVLVGKIRELLADHDWQSVRDAGGPRAFLNAVTGAVNYLRDPATPGNATAEDESGPWLPATGTPPGSWPVRGRCAPDPDSWRNYAKKSRRTKRSGCGWANTTPKTAPAAANPSRRTSSACSGN